MPGKPAAHMSSQHFCPAPLSSATGTHVGGVVTASGSSKVFVNGKPIAVETDTCVCPDPGNSIMKGSSTVFAGGKGVARQMDSTVHGGQIMTGSHNVFVGG